METPVEGIDFNAALAQFKMEKVFQRILGKYRESVPKILEDLCNFVNNGTPPDGLNDYIITVHGLKGASYGIQANYIGDLAKELEFAGKDGNIALIAEKNSELVAEANALLERLAAYLEAV